MWRLVTRTLLWAEVLSKEPYPNAHLQDALPEAPHLGQVNNSETRRYHTHACF